MAFRIFVYLLTKFIKLCLWIAYAGNVFENLDNGMSWAEAKEAARRQASEVPPETRKRIKKMINEEYNRHSGNK